jgi:hypothetical protein
MVALTLDEVTAVLQYLAIAKRNGQPFWSTLWKGGELPIEHEAKEPPPLSAPFYRHFRPMVRGARVTWNLGLTVLLGIWMMVIPSVVALEKIARDNDYIVGALTVTISAVAIAEVTRIARFLITILAIWSLISQFFFDGNSAGSIVAHVVTTSALILLSLWRGRIRESYGSWNKFIK